MLLRAGADPLLTTPGEHSSNVPLEAAACYGKIDVVRELLRWCGIEGCGGVSGGVYALESAAVSYVTDISNHIDIMAVLTNAGVVDDGTALIAAATKGRGAAAKFLLQHQGKTDQGCPYVRRQHM